MLDILGLKINIIQLILPIVYITFGSIFSKKINIKSNNQANFY